MSDWLGSHAWLLPWLFALSLASLLLVLIALPIVVIKLPSDYFRASERAPLPARRHHPVVWMPLVVVKNAIALAFIALGVALLVLPGQGLLTILVGLLLLDFPGKYRTERWLVARPRIFATLNAIRARAGKPPFALEAPPPLP